MPIAVMVAMARLPRLIVPTDVVRVISGGLPPMLAAIDLARAAIASPDCLITGATMSVRIMAAAVVSSWNDTSLLMLLSIAYAYW